MDARKVVHYRNPRSDRLVGILAILALLTACAARQPGDPLEPGFNIYTPEEDVEIGRRAAREIETQVQVVRDRAIEDYIADLGRSIAASDEARGYPYQFTLINDPSINAFALPGGPIYIHTGVPLAAANEAQLAGVMAHEISHVALRHGTNQASTASLAEIPAVLAGAAIGQDSTLAQLGQLGLGFGVNSLMLRYSRNAEREADALGARLMAEAGYDPIEMASFFETLEAEGGDSGLPEFFSSHPSPGNRIENVRAELETLPERNYDRSTGRFPQFKLRVQGLPEPQQVAAIAQLDVPDHGSDGFDRFEGQDFSVSYPSEWDVYGDGRSRGVTIAPYGGIIRSSAGDGLAYGAVFGFFPTTADSLSGGTRALLSAIGSVNPGLEVREGSESIDLGGGPGLATELSGRSPLHGEIEHVLLLTTRQEAGLFYAIFVSPETDFGDFSPLFDVMQRSVRF